MREVGAFEAKTYLLALLDEVARGETIIIAKPRAPSGPADGTRDARQGSCCRRSLDPSPSAQAHRLGYN